MIYCQSDEIYEPLKPKLQYETDVIHCSCCEKELVKVYMPDITLKVPLTYRFKCPFCSESSFKRTFTKKMWFEPINCKLIDVKYDEIIEVELK